MQFLLYDILVHAALILLSPYFLFKMIFVGKYRRGLKERLGFIAPEKLAALKKQKTVWFHAVSVGETKAVIAVVRLFKEKHPEANIVFSTVTKTGNEVAAKEGAALVDTLIYFPLDLSWVARRVVAAVRPALFVVVEKEIWPNAIFALNDAGVKVAVVNGTISEKSFERYKKFAFFFAPIFGSVAVFCARTSHDAKAAIELGVPEKNVVVAGNLKFDSAPVTIDEAKREEIRKALSIESDSMVLTAGSTHRGEEEIVLGAFIRLKEKIPALRLVLAPRHPERFGEVEALVKKRGAAYALRTNGAKGEDVVILNTVGELMTAYSLSSVCIVGGSFVEGIGGHNLMEPAFFSKPAVYGPYLTTYKYMADMLEEAGGGVTANGADGLYNVLTELFSDTPRRSAVGRAGAQVVEANKGVAKRTLAELERLLE